MGIAHELITRGWTSGLAERDDGSVCLVGATLRASGIAPAIDYLPQFWGLPEEIHDAFARVLGTTPGLAMGIAVWNDAPERTYDEVLRVAKTVDEILGL